MTTLRLRPSERVAGTIWGLIVTAAAVTAMVALSGYNIDTELVLIAALVALGGWLVISAVLAARPKRVAQPAGITEPVESGEPVESADPADES